jgi:tetratricopeptide (TPR) repeat protein/DNA-binding XRE family transcriptional regulator
MAAKRHHLAQRRRALGYSQEALASVLDVERSTVVRWEGGETEPLPWIRPKLAQTLRVSTDELAELLASAALPPSVPPPPAPPQSAPAPDLGSDPDVTTPPPDALSPDMPWPQVPVAAPAADPARETRPVSQLPPAVTDFTGRTAQAAQLTELLLYDGDRVGVPVAVIAGLPGAGKTALALHVAHTLRPEFPDGQLWVPLEGATGHPRHPGEVLGELARALGAPGSVIPNSTAERASLYRSLLAGRRVLVLADDAASAAQVQPLLPGTGQCAVLVTSRSELAGPPGSRLVSLDPLTPDESLQLLTKIVGQQRVTADPATAVELAAACGQLPLAVRIAGSRLAARASWPLSAFARRVIHARRRLDELQAGEMSVRASLTQSYHTLDEPARRAFRRLALLDASEITEWQVAALLGTSDAADVVNRLADNSLLTEAGIDLAGQPRYRLHDLLRDYAAEQLEDEPQAEQEAALTRVMAAWLQLAALAGASLPHEPFFPPPPPPPPTLAVAEPLASAISADPIGWFSTERLSLHAAIARCCADAHHETAARLAACLAGFQHLQGRLDDAERAWQMIAAAAQRAGDPAATAQAQLRLAAATCGQGRHAQARPIVDQCVAAFEGLADDRALATACYWHACCGWNLNRNAEAQRFAHRAISLAQSVGDRQIEALALRILALTIADAPHAGSSSDEAVAAAERAQAVAGTLTHRALQHEVLHTAAVVYQKAGRYEDALRLCQNGLELARSLRIQVATAEWAGIHGDACHGLGRYREAIDALGTALPIFRDHFMRRHHGLCLLKMGDAYLAMGDDQNAVTHLTESLDIFSQLELNHYVDRARQSLSTCQAMSSPQ